VVALGADAATAGRAQPYALGAAGEAGVDWVLDLFRADMERTMALLGCRTLTDLSEYMRSRAKSAARFVGMLSVGIRCPAP
jgi:(S)-mandelate dehydrogenase